MNEQIKNTRLSKRFEQDASDGFNGVAGAEEYFASIPNPFTGAKAPQKLARRSRGTGNVMLELGIAFALLILAKILFFNVDHNVSINYGQEEIPNIDMPADTRAKSLAATHTLPLYIPAGAQKSKAHIMPPAQAVQVVHDTTYIREYVPVLPFTAKPDINSIPVPEPANPGYNYADVRDRYRLSYVHDMLVINYSDTSKPKLNPILSGVPALYETKEQFMRFDEPTSFERTDGYLKDLDRPMQHFRNNRYAQALGGLNRLMEENGSDENALFYGGVCLYETGNYTRALVYFGKLKTLPQTLFDQETDWYMALCLHAQGKNNTAKQLLEKIAHSDSFYRTQARSMLAKF